MKSRRKGSWGLRLLALALAIVIYHVLKNESLKNFQRHERIHEQSR